MVVARNWQVVAVTTRQQARAEVAQLRADPTAPVWCARCQRSHPRAEVQG